MAQPFENIYQKYGKLTITDVYDTIHYPKTKHYRVLCDCDCGEKDIVVWLHNLRFGTAKTCGCSAGTTIRQRIGQKFNHLTIVKHIGDKISENHKWKYKKVKCLCDCGKHRVCYLNNVIQGTVKHCGCLKKVGQIKYDKRGPRYFVLIKGKYYGSSKTRPGAEALLQDIINRKAYK